MKSFQRCQVAAFTLVELSIVLVILGLLVGGVLSGQSLIRAAELRAVTRESQQYQTALGAFRDKYFAMPGDMNNAVKYWGAAAGATTDGADSTCTALATASTDQKTCNGNGDGLIAGQSMVPASELFRAWQQLANAGMVEGSFSGVKATGAFLSWQTATGINVPRSKIANAGWTLYGMGDVATAGAYAKASYGNSLFFGVATTDTGLTDNPILKPEEAYNIDMKMDDGKPTTGKILSYRYGMRPDCSLSDNSAYNLAGTVIGCQLVFITGY